MLVVFSGKHCLLSKVWIRNRKKRLIWSVSEKCTQVFFNVPMKNCDLFSLGHNAMSEEADKCKLVKYIDQ